jgi:dTDP-4-dehydrorhamnose reductase
VIDTVYITGGSGLLALNWALEIRGRQRVLLGLHSRKVAPAGIETRAARLDSIPALVEDFTEVGASLVVHTAGLTTVEGCESNPALAQRINVEIAENVARACANLGLPLVHISTDHLFSGEVPLVDEDEPTDPINVYGRTKAEAEVRVLAAHPGALVVRTNFFGWGPQYRRSFSDTILASLRSGEPTTLFQDVFYTPILIENLVRAVHELVDRGVSGIFNVTGDERISKCDFGYMIAREFDLDPRLIRPGFLADKPGLVQRPHDMSLSNTKIAKLLGRKLGGPREHLARLQEQEQMGLASEMRAL